jgi:pyrroline-5-carboxylate reductase
VWLEREELLDAVTALSGSGPAYVFYFLESMIESGVAMGLSPAQARQLSIETFSGASALARESKDSIADLRQRVTSKGGTTHAAISAMENDQVNLHFSRALMAARDRAYTLGTEFGDS